MLDVIISFKLNQVTTHSLGINTKPVIAKTDIHSSLSILLLVDCLGILMGGNHKTFTNNYELNSLAAAHRGATVKVQLIDVP